MKEPQKNRITGTLCAIACIMLSGCATEYALYDASHGTPNKSYVEFYSKHPMQRADTEGYLPTAVYLVCEGNAPEFIGRAGSTLEKRLRISLPPGMHTFRCAPQQHDDDACATNITVSTIAGMVIPVEATSKQGAAASFFVVARLLMNAKCDVTVEAPRPVNPNDYDWKAAGAAK